MGLTNEFTKGYLKPHKSCETTLGEFKQLCFKRMFRGEGEQETLQREVTVNNQRVEESDVCFTLHDFGETVMRKWTDQTKIGDKRIWDLLQHNYHNERVPTLRMTLKPETLGKLRKAEAGSGSTTPT